MLARVIVDVPAKGTDRPFDYIVPEPLQSWIAVGSRVAVPFGPRAVQGFVVGLCDRTGEEGRKLKEIDSVLDVEPPLTQELVELAAWMSKQYLCREITALQAMIPGALKAKYERRVTVNEDRLSASGLELFVPEHLDMLGFIRKKDGVSLTELLGKFPECSRQVKEWIREGILAEEQIIKDRVAKKKVLTVFPPERTDDLQKHIDSLPKSAKRQKDVLVFLAANPSPIRLTELAVKLEVGAGTVKSLADKGMVELKEVELLRDPYAGRTFQRTLPLSLTEEQKRVFQPLREAVEGSRHEIFLLHGVTGSGKTEVYLQSIQACLDLGREAIVLVPEISLTPQMVERFKGRFGDDVAVLHSRLSLGERYDEWRKIAMKQVKVVIGARSAIFAPFTKLGLIIIDEEHESSYKQEESPKYHTREVAAARARAFGASVLLGSATPSLESYYAAVGAESLLPANGNLPARPESVERSRGSAPFRLLTMAGRVEDRPLPPVHIVDMREELKAGNRSMFSRSLHQALEERLRKKEQSVLLLNRRGYSTFVMCRSCGHTLACPHCEISLTYHQSSGTVRCHYCGYAERQPRECPSCGSTHIRYFGTGTQRVEEELAKLFPGIRVIRMDVDTTTEKGSHEALLTRFGKKQADVLLGTQMVAKGLDFPDVTLVGVITADTVLNLPDFRSAERTFQLLTQVAGRAGRHQLPGEVFVQTYTPEHYSIVAASRHDYAAFVETEMRMRRIGGYPPFCRLILITLTHEQLPLLVRAAESFAKRMKELAAEAGIFGFQKPDPASDTPAIEVLGPASSPIPRIKDRYRFQCMVKYRGNVPVTEIVSRAADTLDDLCRQERLQISIDVDPQVLM